MVHRLLRKRCCTEEAGLTTPVLCPRARARLFGIGRTCTNEFDPHRSIIDPLRELITMWLAGGKMFPKASFSHMGLGKTSRSCLHGLCKSLIVALLRRAFDSCRPGEGGFAGCMSKTPCAC